MAPRRGVLAPALSVVCLLASLLFCAESRANDTFIVIVNADNPVSSLSVEEISKLFLKRVVTWQNGQPVVPVDLPADSQLRDDFSRAIHGKPCAPIVAYWQQQIFSGREVPPVQLASEGEILRFVQENRNAIGYVAASTVVGNRLKVLRVSGP